MEEVATTLTELGIDPAMSLAAAAWQRRLGALEEIGSEGLDAKLAAIIPRKLAKTAWP
jgi:hypothetical protein